MASPESSEPLVGKENIGLHPHRETNDRQRERIRYSIVGTAMENDSEASRVLVFRTHERTASVPEAGLAVPILSSFQSIWGTRALSNA